MSLTKARVLPLVGRVKVCWSPLPVSAIGVHEPADIDVLHSAPYVTPATLVGWLKLVTKLPPLIVPCGRCMEAPDFGFCPKANSTKFTRPSLS